MTTTTASWILLVLPLFISSTVSTGSSSTGTGSKTLQNPELATSPSLPLSLRSLEDGVSSPWDESERLDSFVPYPPELSPLLEREFNELYLSPAIHVFSTLPEPPLQRLWPLIKAITVRNHRQNFVTWAHPVYWIVSGLDVGCRQVTSVDEDDNSVEEQVNSTLCLDHCTHGGRYCYPFDVPLTNVSRSAFLLPPHVKGREVVTEVLRRQCFDLYFESSDYEFFDYLERMDNATCWHQTERSLTNCSMEVVFDSMPNKDYQILDWCVGNPAVDDMPNELLDDQLRTLQQYNFTSFNSADLQLQLPALAFGNVMYDGEYSVKSIFHAYCDTFRASPGEYSMAPLSCDICEPCGDVRSCLWTLECDGVPFDGMAFVESYLGATGEDEYAFEVAWVPLP